MESLGILLEGKSAWSTWLQSANVVNGLFRDLNWRYLTYIMPIFKGLISGNIPPKYGQKYGTNVPPFEDPEDFFIDVGLTCTQGLCTPHPSRDDQWKLMSPPYTFPFLPFGNGCARIFLWTGPMFNPKHRIWIFTSYSISVVLERQMISLNIYRSNWNPDHIFSEPINHSILGFAYLLPRNQSIFLVDFPFFVHFPWGK
jgi:hypothetical protein